MPNLIDGDRILALVKGEAVGLLACKCTCHVLGGSFPHSVLQCEPCKGTGTEPENEVERAVAGLRAAYVDARSERPGYEALTQALEAERAAHRITRAELEKHAMQQPTWAELDNEKAAHEETKRRLQLVRAKMCMAFCERTYYHSVWSEPRITHCRLCEEIRNG